jgi:fused signal recognition particle receptor
MAEEKKRGLFSRLFGRGTEEAPKTVVEAPAAPERAPEPSVAPSEFVTADLTPEMNDAEAIAVAEAIEPAAVDVRDEPGDDTVLVEPFAEQDEPDAQENESVDAVEERPPAAIPATEPEPVPVPAPAPQRPAKAPEPARRSWLQRLKEGLSRTSGAVGGGIVALFTKRKIDASTLDDLEDILIQADLGLDVAMRITDTLRGARYAKGIDPGEVKAILAAEVERVLEPVAWPLVTDIGVKPFVLLMVGVNGSGKTTTIGKISAKFRAEGKKVLLAAGDTFRAAAVEQLKVWGERTGTPVFSREQGADAAGLAFDALKQAQADDCDVLIIDTAGRLQNKTELMAELEKVIRVIRKVDASAPHATLLVLDATVGQNALSQVEIFGKTAGVTGLVMTKLDGTARGGILVAIADKHVYPVHYIGVGEGVDDLEPFTAKDFARVITGLDD